MAIGWEKVLRALDSLTNSYFQDLFDPTAGNLCAIADYIEPLINDAHNLAQGSNVTKQEVKD